jgi:hypothetical protein
MQGCRAHPDELMNGVVDARYAVCCMLYAATQSVVVVHIVVMLIHKLKTEEQRAGSRESRRQNVAVCSVQLCGPCTVHTKVWKYGSMKVWKL